MEGAYGALQRTRLLPTLTVADNVAASFKNTLLNFFVAQGRSGQAKSEQGHCLGIHLLTFDR